MIQKELYKTIVAISLVLVFSVFQARILNFGIEPKSMVIPIIVNTVIIGWAIGKDTSEKASDSILRGLEISSSVYLVMFSWLYSVGFFTGSNDLAFMQLCSSIFLGTMTSWITREIPQLF